MPGSAELGAVVVATGKRAPAGWRHCLIRGMILACLLLLRSFFMFILIYSWEDKDEDGLGDGLLMARRRERRP